MEGVMVPDWLFLLLAGIVLWLPLMAIGWWLTAMMRARFLPADARKHEPAGGGLLWILWSLVGFPAIGLAVLWILFVGRGLS
jgi:hypothetical protein